jgi:hypothetical protein
MSHNFREEGMGEPSISTEQFFDKLLDVMEGLAPIRVADMTSSQRVRYVRILIENVKREMHRSSIFKPLEQLIVDGTGLRLGFEVDGEFTKGWGYGHKELCAKLASKSEQAHSGRDRQTSLFLTRSGELWLCERIETEYKGLYNVARVSVASENALESLLSGNGFASQVVKAISSLPMKDAQAKLKILSDSIGVVNDLARISWVLGQLHV